jgi:hypothetical protein
MDPINQNPAVSQASSNGKIILGVVVVLAIAAVIYFMSAAPAVEENTVKTNEPAQDTTAVIKEEIEKVDMSELDAALDADLKDIDAQLNNL